MNLSTTRPAVISSFVGVSDSLYVYILVRETFPQIVWIHSLILTFNTYHKFRNL